MRSTFIAAVVASAAFAAPASAGEEPTKYDIEWHEHWKVGQMATVTQHDTSDSETTMSGNKVQADHEALDATYVVRCDAVNDKGAPSKRTFFFKSWKQTKDDDTDESLAGLTVVVDGKTWSLPAGKTAGALATKWLDEKFKKGKDDPLSKLAPPTKMAVGQTWKPETKAVAELFASSMDDAPFDAERVSMELTLASVDGTPPDASGKFEFKARLAIASTFKGLPPGATVAPTSGADFVGTHIGPLTTSTMLAADHLEATIAMNIEMDQGGQKLGFLTTGRMVQQTKTVAGGEIPEPAKAEPAKPDAEKPPAPAPAPGPK